VLLIFFAVNLGFGGFSWQEVSIFPSWFTF
jgi:hypothetical protein